MKARKELYNLYQNRPKELENYLESEGYKNLGWQISQNNPDYKKCLDSGHFTHSWNDPNQVIFSIQHNSRGSNVTDWCTVCKNYWKTDMSD